MDLQRSPVEIVRDRLAQRVKLRARDGGHGLGIGALVGPRRVKPVDVTVLVEPEHHQPLLARDALVREGELVVATHGPHERLGDSALRRAVHAHVRRLSRAPSTRGELVAMRLSGGKPEEERGRDRDEREEAELAR